jgi:cytochrome c554/c'-like protein
VLFVSLCVLGLNAQDHVGKPVPTYVTGDECLFCHRVKVADTWQQNPHARTVFPNEKGEEFVGSKLARPLRRAGYGKFDILEADKKTWNKEKFANRCAGCHTTAVDPETKAFSATALDCYTCHGVADPNHTKDTALMRFSAKYPKNSREIVSVCGSCHLRGGKSHSSGLPYPNNFVPGDDLFHDFEVDLSQTGSDRHVFSNVRDVLKNGSTTTCINCHAIHTDSSAKHKRVLTTAICQDCHNAEGPKSVVRKNEVHSALCEY